MKILKKLEDYTLPSGDALLEKWIAGLKIANKHLQAGDNSAVAKIAQEIFSILRALLPSIPDKIVYEAVESLPKEFENNLKKKMIAGTATLADMNEYFRFMCRTMVSAMSKTKPTAETLN